MQSLKDYISDYVNETMSEETAQLRRVRDTAYRFLRNAKIKGDPNKLAAAQARYDSAVKAYEKGRLADKNMESIRLSKKVMNTTELANAIKGMGWLYINKNKYGNGWNAWIEGFGEKDGKLTVLIYWQGDSTDGSFSVTIIGIPDINVPARNGHPEIKIKRSLLEAAIQEAINKVNAMVQNSKKNKDFVAKNINKAIKDPEVIKEISRRLHMDIKNIEYKGIIDTFDQKTGEAIQLAKLTIAHEERNKMHYTDLKLDRNGLPFFSDDPKKGYKSKPEITGQYEEWQSYFN